MDWKERAKSENASGSRCKSQSQDCLSHNRIKVHTLQLGCHEQDQRRWHMDTECCWVKTLFGDLNTGKWVFIYHSNFSMSLKEWRSFI